MFISISGEAADEAVGSIVADVSTTRVVEDPIERLDVDRRMASETIGRDCLKLLEGGNVEDELGAMEVGGAVPLPVELALSGLSADIVFRTSNSSSSSELISTTSVPSREGGLANEPVVREATRT